MKNVTQEKIPNPSYSRRSPPSSFKVKKSEKKIEPSCYDPIAASVNKIGVLESNMSKYVLYPSQFIRGQLTSNFRSTGVIPFSKTDGSMSINGGKPIIVLPGLYSISLSIMNYYNGPYHRIILYADGKKICAPHTNFRYLPTRKFYSSLSCTASVMLNQGSNVYFHNDYADGVWGGSYPHSTFSMHLVKPI